MTPAASRIRLLVITDEMEVGGTQRQIVQMLLGLDRSRFDPEVIYFRNRSFFVDQLESAGIPVTLVAKRRRIDLPFLLRLRARIAAGRFDVVHCFALTGELWGAAALALIAPRRRPALLTSIRNNFDWAKPIHRQIKRWGIARSWQVVANSRAGALGAQQSMGLPDGVIRVIYNGVPEPEQAPADADLLRQNLSLPDAPIILFVGRLVEQKDVGTLIAAMGELRHTAAHLVIAGDGPLRAELEQQGKDLKVADRVHFLGQRDDATHLMRQADLVVLPSIAEGLSNVILEAMMIGRPVIASRVGGNVELIEKERTGLLFPARDHHALAGALQRLIDNPAERAAMGEAARHRALREFSVAAMVRAFATTYEQAVASRCARQPHPTVVQGER